MSSFLLLCFFSRTCSLHFLPSPPLTPLSPPKFGNYMICSGDLASRKLHKLMLAVEISFPQAKRQALAREYKQRQLQLKRSSRQHHKQIYIYSSNENESFTDDTDDAYSHDDDATVVPSFATLPRECMEIIFQHLDPITLAHAACTCSSWRDCASSNDLWLPLIQLTFGNASPRQPPTTDLPSITNDDDDGFYDRRFSEMATRHPDWLLPWRTDRITCHGAVRWISPQTRQRVMTHPGPAGIAWNRTVGVAFLATDEIVVWLDRRTPKFLETVTSWWKNKERTRLREMNTLRTI